MLERQKIPYEYKTYECEEFVSGIFTADQTGLPHELVYKTLVTTGKTGAHYVFVIPIEAELDLKKAARAVNEIGMKKQFPTVVDQSAEEKEQIYISGGKLGMQLKLKPDDLCRAAGAVYGEITM